MIEFEPCFPYGVADYLAECKAKGLLFDEAWTRELDDAAKRAGFIWQPRPFALESSLAFAKRHFEAAYNSKPALRYCAEEDCVYLALFGDHCVMHAIVDVLEHDAVA